MPTPIASHTHIARHPCMYLNRTEDLQPRQVKRCSSTLRAAEFRRTKKKVAWCDCDNSPPPFFPRLLLCGETMETLIRKMQDCGEDLIRSERATRIPSLRREGTCLAKSKERLIRYHVPFPDYMEDTAGSTNGIYDPDRPTSARPTAASPK